MYRSMGYTPAQARNMRNRSTPRLIDDYRSARATYEEKRIASYKKDFDAPYDPPQKPYRPDIPLTEKQQFDYESYFRENSLSEAHMTEIFSTDNQFTLDIYQSRIDGLKDNLTAQGYDWDEIMSEMLDWEWGDVLDYLGGLYGDD